MKKVKIRDKFYNCSNAVYWHIAGLESQVKLLKNELSVKDRIIYNVQKENKEANQIKEEK